MSKFERSSDNMAQLYGYVRVSTREQSENRQLVAMQDFGIPDGTFFLISKVVRILIGQHTDG